MALPGEHQRLAIFHSPAETGLQKRSMDHRMKQQCRVERRRRGARSAGSGLQSSYKNPPILPSSFGKRISSLGMGLFDDILMPTARKVSSPGTKRRSAPNGRPGIPYYAGDGTMPRIEIQVLGLPH